LSISRIEIRACRPAKGREAKGDGLKLAHLYFGFVFPPERDAFNFIFPVYMGWEVYYGKEKDDTGFLQDEKRRGKDYLAYLLRFPYRAV
jgi:hypothetical protein